MNGTFLILENDGPTAMEIARLIVNKNNRVIVKKSILDAKNFIYLNYIDCIVASENIIDEISIAQEIENDLINRRVPIVYLHTGRNSNISSDLNIVATIPKPFDPEKVRTKISKIPIRNNDELDLL